MPEYPIIEVPLGTVEEPEQLGAKPKFWFEKPGGTQYLCKIVRPNTGEDWSEKIAAEIASLLGIPHANYDLGIYENQRCVISESVVAPSAGFIHGNELLSIVNPSYGTGERVRRYVEPGHTIEAVLEALDIIHCAEPISWYLSAGEFGAKGTFAGYVFLDALIGNTDRHHQNWAVTIGPGLPIWYLAASFDHASSLGRELSDNQRLSRLATRDKGYTPEAYADRSTSALFLAAEDHRPMRTLEAFRHAKRLLPENADSWLRRLAETADDRFDEIVASIPDSRMSQPARQFARRMLMHNRFRLLQLREES